MDGRRLQAKDKDEQPTLEPPDLATTPNEEMEQAENAEQGQLAKHRPKKRTMRMKVRRKKRCGN